MSQDKVFMVMRTDYIHQGDEGRVSVISVHATFVSAMEDLEVHKVLRNQEYGIDYSNATYNMIGEDYITCTVTIGDAELHSYDISIVARPLEYIPARDELYNGEELLEERLTKTTKTNDVQKAAPKAKSQPKAKGKAAAKSKKPADDANEDDKNVDGEAEAPKPKKKAASKRKAPTGDEDDEDEEAMPSAPTGSSDALAGKKFLITGTLEGLNRDEGQALIHKHGGQCVKAIPKTEKGTQPDYIVLGVKPGQAKLDEIQKRGFSTIKQEELYEMIENGTGPKAKKAKI